MLHHDLRADLRHACRCVMQVQGALPGRPTSRPSQIQVVTPYNEPVGNEPAPYPTEPMPLPG